MNQRGKKKNGLKEVRIVGSLIGIALRGQVKFLKVTDSFLPKKIIAAIQWSSLKKKKKLASSFSIILFAHIDFKSPLGQRLHFIEIYFTVHMLMIQACWKSIE